VAEGLVGRFVRGSGDGLQPHVARQMARFLAEIRAK
jgi:hypothetical protein